MFFIAQENEALWEKIKRITQEYFPLAGQDILITKKQGDHLGFELSMGMSLQKDRWRSAIYAIANNGEKILVEKDGSMEELRASFCY
ncbi:hypothetical protein KC842_02165 [Candidatus Nomurabacteria bacterium]|nr:hypothetical protein [Candidatus Nomurabacteria bacterium]